MSMCNCSFRCPCTAAALIISAIAGVIAAFLQISGTITVAPVFLIAVIVTALVYLGVLAVTAALSRCEVRRCLCAAVNTVLAGILGSILFAAVLLAVGIVATSVLSALLVGIVVFFATLILTATACYVRTLADCGE